MQRREFLRHLGAISAGASLGQLGIMSSKATTTPGDYKALVCVFMFGGNDGNNTIVPIDTTGYANYSAVRGALALPQASLVPLQETNGSARFGLHPNLSAWQSLWTAGHLGVLFNTGTLVQPFADKAAYLSASSAKPQSLFSHIDQQAQWQTSIADAPSRTGWGGRVADQIAGLNAGASIPTMISTIGPNLFVTGGATSALTVPISGSFGLRGFDTSAAATTRLTALKQMLNLDKSSELISAAQDITTSAIANSATLNPVLMSTTGQASAAFSGLNTSVAQQLLAVAKIIEARSALNIRRQVFMVSLGGFDTHTNELNTHNNLFGQLGPALKAFHDALVTLGEINNVTTFTLSDFARTFQPNTGGGTDHAWGNHHFVMGGSVKGQQYYGAFPTLALNGPDDAGEGRWIPTTAVDQYAATLASWFGVDAAGLSTVLPNLGNFASKDLGFMA